MNIVEFVEKKKSIQNALLEFLEEESAADDKFENFVNLVTGQQIIKDQYEFKELLHLISNIGNNHHRSPNFIIKLERLLRQFKQDIKIYFSNSEIFEIFKDNKRILLFLIEEKLMIIDESIFSIITSDKYVEKNYCEYFQPEIKPLLTQENIEKYGSKNKSLKDDKFIERMNKEIEENFYDKRREGLNDDYLCELIRLDKIKEFITFTEQRNLSLKSEINKSIFETNQLLTDNKKISLIKYALFYGSNDIIKYMINKKINITPSMFIYAVHSCNVELIKFLEAIDDLSQSYSESESENDFKNDSEDSSDFEYHYDYYESVLFESIKCHHIEISKYIIENLIGKYFKNEIKNNTCDNIFIYAAEYFNYCFFPTNMECENMFFYLCENGYYTLVKIYLSESKIDINETIKTLIIQITF